MRRTKIICTIGPSTNTESMIRKLAEAGMNMARLNFSHGTHESHKEVIKMVKTVNAKYNYHIGIMLDTKGPELRVGEMENGSVDFKRGDIVKVVKDEVVGNHERFYIACKEIFDDVQTADRILINDGKLRLDVKENNGEEITCVVFNDGPISTKKGVNIPNVRLSMPFISEKDDADIRFGAQMGVDFIAASFVRRPADVQAIRKILKEEGHPEIEIIAKIENQEGYDNLKDILKVADAIMVARGDLGVEVDCALVPLYQKKMIQAANSAGKPVITATHMLDSMITNPSPTRAEASDVSNAIFDGTDCIMLSGETASGKYPVEAVETMSRIARAAEGTYDYRGYLNSQIDYSTRTMSDAIGIAVAESCLTMNNISAIMAFTETGGTPKRLSKYKPVAPIIAATNSLSTCRKMSLYSDVFPCYAPNIVDSDLYDLTAQQVAKQMNLPEGSTYIITAGWHAGHGNTNTMRFASVETEKEEEND
ncbi:MAG: pyruvate kinase [Erysipelotrichaceae bacterium]|nr:pyruvate kinase [Erysipelotrichaceae bacterium]